MPQSLKNSLIVWSLLRKKISSSTCRWLSSSKKLTWVLRASLMMSIFRHATGISILFNYVNKGKESSFFHSPHTESLLWYTHIIHKINSVFTFSTNKPKAVSTWANMPSNATKSIWPADIFGVSSTEPFLGWISSPYWAWSILEEKNRSPKPHSRVVDFGGTQKANKSHSWCAKSRKESFCINERVFSSNGIWCQLPREANDSKAVSAIIVHRIKFYIIGLNLWQFINSKKRL